MDIISDIPANRRLRVVFRGTDQETREIMVLLLAIGVYAEQRPEEPIRIIISGQKSGKSGWIVLVDERQMQYAYDAITAYRFENRVDRVPLPAPAVQAIKTCGRFGFIVSSALILFFSFAGPFTRDNLFFQSGALIKSRALDGEIWRAVTALTMHGDIRHLAGNIVVLLIFASGVCQILGVELGWFLILLSGISGNIIKVMLHNYEYFSIGSSTAVFGAVGLLGGLVYIIQKRQNRRSAWISIAAAVVLLGFLGSDSKSDILAHFYGFLSGLAMSIFSEKPRSHQTTGNDF